jgi:hypothetical protein
MALHAGISRMRPIPELDDEYFWDMVRSINGASIRESKPSDRLSVIRTFGAIGGVI